ncbi:MAG: MBL fold metallo-hydrolase [Candidatus Riflebacteria bacterium]|nr:MBL fold metallo-hydrolase [Candidatus Riflebacteria bacterium]
MNSPLFPLQDQLKGFSRALFTTWLYHKRFNILFDCGEGVATSLQNRVFGIRRIFLSHGHADHIAGLVNLLNIRNLGAGDQTAPLQIYYPKENKLLEYMIDYLTKTQKDLSFPLIWVPLEPGETLHLEDQKGYIYIRTFETKHSQRQLSLGYNIIETRRRLKPEYVNMKQSELNQIIWEKGKDEIAEDYQKIIFSYGGDSRPICPDDIKDSLYLCHEATYLSKEDDERNFQQHSFLEEVLINANEASVETLLLMHTSLRYSLQEIYDEINILKNKLNLSYKILLLFGDIFIDTDVSLVARKKAHKSRQNIEELKINSEESNV